MKRLLAYSSIENIGVLFTGIGLTVLRPELGERARQRPVEMIDLRFEQWYYRMQGESP